MTTEDITGTRRRQVGLGQALAEFVRHPSPWMMASIVVGALVARIVVGDWRVSDLWAPLAFVAVFPIIEWVIHVFVLHWRPRRVGRITLDTLLARKHRAHHADPRNIALVFIPLQVLIVSLTVALVGFWVLLPTPQLAFTTMATSFWMLLTYEWTHYLIHSPYRPQTRFYRYIWRAHRLHHYRNERYWFGVTVHVADHVLRTFPEKDAVPVSPTARTLGVTEVPAAG